MRIPAALWFPAVAWIGLAVMELYAAADSLAANRLDSEAERISAKTIGFDEIQPQRIARFNAPLMMKWICRIVAAPSG